MILRMAEAVGEDAAEVGAGKILKILPHLRKMRTENPRINRK